MNMLSNHDDCPRDLPMEAAGEKPCQVKGRTISVIESNQGGRHSSNIDSTEVSTSKSDDAFLVFGQPLHLVGGIDDQHSMESDELDNDRDLPLDGDAFQVSIDAGSPLLVGLWEDREIKIKDATEVSRKTEAAQVSGDEYHPHSECHSPESHFDSDSRSTEAASPGMDKNQDQLETKPSSKESDQDCSTMSFSQLFGEILLGFREKRHYDDEEATETEPCASNYSADRSVSPVPLSPEVEQRHLEARIRDNRNKLDAGSIQAGVVTRADSSLDQAFDRVSAQLSPKAPEPCPSTNKTEEMNMTAKEETAAKAKRGTRRKDEDPSPDRVETTPQCQAEVGLGFFSKLQEHGLYDQVLGSTGAKKKRKKAVRRRRKPKADPLEGVSMGFFSGQMSHGPTNKKKAEREEVSDRLKPLYHWAPVLDERALAQFELASPLILPWLAVKSNFTSFARAYCMVLPFVHTLEALLTNFGPNASRFHLRCAPLSPFAHMCIDLCLNLPMCVACFVCPEPFGKNAYLIGTVFCALNYVYWAVSYKNVVIRRIAPAKKMKAQ